jgi:Flp pilus assembly protein TadD
VSIDSTAIRPESADAPVRNDAWILHSQGRRFGPLTEDELRGYFRAGMVKAGDSIEMPGAPAAVTADAVAAMLGMPAPAAAPGPAPVATSIIVTQTNVPTTRSWLIALGVLVALGGIGYFALHKPLRAPVDSQDVAFAPPMAQPAGAARADETLAAAPTAAPAPPRRVSIEPPMDSRAPAQPAGPTAAPPEPVVASNGQVPGPDVPDFRSRAGNLSDAQDWSGLLSHAGLWTAGEPSSELAWWYLGLANLRLGSLGEAEAAYHKVLQLSPRHFDARWSLSNVYLRTSRNREAGVLLQELVREQPGNAHAWLDLGVAMTNTGEFDQAVAAYEKSIQLKPDYRLAWANLARCYAKFGYLDRAKAAATKANAL